MTSGNRDILTMTDAASAKTQRPGSRRFLTILAYCLAVGLLGLWGIGLGLFLLSRKTVTIALPATEEHPAEHHNLVAFKFGPTIRVSSYLDDAFAQHHPAFLVDGRQDPSKAEKWCADRDDRNPWVEFDWSGIHEIQSVTIQHAGAVESPDLTARRYKISCLRRDDDNPTISIDGNRDKLVTHPFECSGAAGLRIDFARDRARGPVRVYEIEVWGR